MRIPRFKTTYVLIFLLASAISMPVLRSSVSAQTGGMITGFENGKVRINWGTTDGLVNGIVLNVFKKIDVIHPVTHEKFDTSETGIGKIEITECYPDYSLAKIISASQQFSVGNSVKISFDAGAVSGVLQAAEKGTVTGINNQLVKFNMGRRDGVEEKLIFDVFRVAGPKVHPVTGEVLEARNTYIGKVMVMRVTEEDATAQIIAQEQEIQAGDRVILSPQQTGDLEMMPDTTMGIFAEETAEKPLGLRRQAAEFSLPDNIIAAVTRISGRDIYFIWRGDYGFPAGRVFGVYRREELRHPETKKLIGKPLILLGKIKLIESIGKLGRGVIITSDAEMLPRDFVGLTEGETVESGQIITPGNAAEVYQAQRSDILQQAQELTVQVQQIQAEMTVLGNALDKLDRIDRELAAQKVLSQKLSESVEEIKMLIRNEGFPVESVALQPSRAAAERIESPGSNANILRLKYTDDIDVKLELVNKTLLVSLDIDSAGALSMRPQIPAQKIPQKAAEDTAQIAKDTVTGTGMLEKVGGEETAGAAKIPFYKNWLFLTVFILILFGIAGALYFILVLKKKESEEETEYEEEAELEDVESDEFLEEEIIPEEEEIDSVDEEV